MQSLASFTAPGTMDSEMVPCIGPISMICQKARALHFAAFLLLLERAIPSMLDLCAVVRQTHCIVESVLEFQFPREVYLLVGHGLGVERCG